MFTLLYRMFYAVKQTRYKKEQMFGKFNLQVRAKPYGHPMQVVRNENRYAEPVKNAPAAADASCISYKSFI